MNILEINGLDIALLDEQVSTYLTEIALNSSSIGHIPNISISSTSDKEIRATIEVVFYK
jgi:hypothetical protein